MFRRTSYPSVPTPPETVRELRAAGLSQTRIARTLHISPTKFKERVSVTPELQRALDAGARSFQANCEDITVRQQKQPAYDEDDHIANTPLRALDETILEAIAGGRCDRASIEKLVNPSRNRNIQISPSLERLMLHGKIREVAPGKGSLLTKYEKIPDETAAATN